MIKLKSPAEIERMRFSGQAAAEVLHAVAGAVADGIATAELDELAAAEIRAKGGRAAFLGYHGYPASLCVSINEEVVHGIPGSRNIRSGDIVSLDVGVELDGYIGDCALTVAVDGADTETLRLLDCTRGALDAAIENAVAGRRLSDISHAVEKAALAEGFSVVREFVGHGIGREMHEEPQIPNFGPPGKGPRLRPGMTLAIEPMINLGGPEVEVLSDGWTVRTRDRRPSAHFEHTVLVAEGRAEILTCQEKKTFS